MRKFAYAPDQSGPAIEGMALNVLVVGSRLSVRGAVISATAATMPLSVSGIGWPEFSHSAYRASPPSIMIADIGGLPEIGDHLAILEAARAAAPDIPVIVICDGLSPASMQRIARLGVAGLLGSDVSPEILGRILDLALLGQQVLAAGMLASLLRPAIGEDEDRPDRPMSGWRAGAGAVRLSERENAILDELMHGHSNKVIALKLNISNATVKVHVKALLRKIQVSNRTQAATWALTNPGARQLSPQRGALPL